LEHWNRRPEWGNGVGISIATGGGDGPQQSGQDEEEPTSRSSHDTPPRGTPEREGGKSCAKAVALNVERNAFTAKEAMGKEAARCGVFRLSVGLPFRRGDLLNLKKRARILIRNEQQRSGCA
jgi:hypothetical protein